MIGVLDSGDGGLCTVEKIRELAPNADICFLADRENAPYGTKSRAEILSLTKRGIRRLREAGAEKVLIACCTASSVFPLLSNEERLIAVPIIDPTAKRAAQITKTKRIGVIATSATALSGAFERSVKSILPDASVFTEPTQELVFLVESGARDERISQRDVEYVRGVLSKIISKRPDVLILGCTHFPRLEGTIRKIVCCETVSSALSGAEEIINITNTNGTGTNIFL